MNTSFAQNNSNISNSLTNNTSVSSGSYVLQGISNDGAFKVIVDWKPNNTGKENTFDLTFIDSNSGVQIEDVAYDIMLFKDDQHITESHRADQTARQQKYVFADQGSYTLRIENINNTGAGIDFAMQVIPEFPFSIFALVIALVSTILITKGLLADQINK
jgi:predicted secreted protein with PEFG-CTERM motif